MSENPGKRSSCGNGATLVSADRFRGNAGFISECMSIGESARDRRELFGKGGGIVLQFGHSEAVAVADTFVFISRVLGEPSALQPSRLEWALWLSPVRHGHWSESVAIGNNFQPTQPRRVAINRPELLQDEAAAAT